MREILKIQNKFQIFRETSSFLKHTRIDATNEFLFNIEIFFQDATYKFTLNETCINIDINFAMIPFSIEFHFSVRSFTLHHQS
jgi:hypothetical protein